MLRLLIALMLLSTLVTAREREPAPPDTRTALIIGNARYEPAAGPLRNTVNDARAVAAALKAHNRRGDALLQLGRADDALEASNAAQPLSPDDSYILYNRARAHLALGDADNARIDLQAASDPKFSQPLARELSMKKMLAEMLLPERN